MSLTITENLHSKARRLLQNTKSSSGTSSESERAYDEWNEFVALHPDISTQIANETSNSPNVRGSPTNRPWHEPTESERFEGHFWWTMCLLAMPVGAGFQAEINSLINNMRTHNEHFRRNKSQYGEIYLVGWALHHMPDPTKTFLKWSLAEEENCEELWTITMIEQHLSAWASLFDSIMAQRHLNESRAEEVRRLANAPDDKWKEKYLHSDQKRTGGGYMAHFLTSSPEHVRWAQQMFKALWRDQHENWAGRLGGLPMADMVMSN